MSETPVVRPIALLPPPWRSDAATDLGLREGGVVLWCAGMRAEGTGFLAGDAGAALVARGRRLPEQVPEPWRSAAQDLLERPEPTCWRLRSRSLEVGRRTLLMGILNATPDSFSDGGRHASLDQAVRRAMQIAAEGADILDVGGESTRPGSAPVATEEELARVVPLLQALQREGYPLPISIDTQKWAVAAEALRLGAEIVNDVSAGIADPQMLQGVARAGAGLVLMHGHAGTRAAASGSLQIQDFLRERAEAAEAAGVARASIALDPGIGFGKEPKESFAAMRSIGELRLLGYPVLLGPSRKRFLAAATARPVDEREYATAAAVALGVALGADIVRVHAVGPMRDAARVADWAVRG